MGSICSRFCCNCCPKKTNEETVNPEKDPIGAEVRDEMRGKKSKTIIIDRKSENKNSSKINEELDEEVVINEEVLTREMRQSDKSDEKCYANAIKHLKANEISNDFVLNDKKSKEFKRVENIMSIKGYKVIESIGSGYYAVVYKAYNRKGSKEVAIKVIDLIKARDRYHIHFIPREVGILRKSKHKNIAKVYEMLRTEDKIYIVMERATKGTIAYWVINRGSFSEYSAWLLFKGILRGLDYMHSLKIAHRNVKLDNILLTDSFDPKLSDFSYALIVDQNSEISESFCGSLPYLSPEILQHLPYNPFLSDIWSSGVCLYIMVNNSLPFDVRNESEMLSKQLHNDWMFRKSIESTLSQSLRNFIALMIEPDINRRTTTDHLLKHQWITNTPFFGQ